MANVANTTVKLDSDATKAINRLAKAIEHQNQLFIEKTRADRDEKPIVMPGDE